MTTLSNMLLNPVLDKVRAELRGCAATLRAASAPALCADPGAH